MSRPGRQSRRAGGALAWGGALVGLASLVASLVGAGTFQIGSADGSFEAGLGGMVAEGDASIVPSFGAVFPTEGNRALLMTTAPDSGSTPADADSSSVRIENLTVPSGFAEIRLDLDFFTNEPLPSRTNDRFAVDLVVVGSGESRRLLQVDTFDRFHRTFFSPYAKHSGLRAMRADVSAYAGTGEALTLELRVADVGDGRRDSAVLVDNLRLVESGAPVARLNADYLEVAVNETIRFDGSASTDDGTIVEYRWDFGNGYYGFGKFLDFSYLADGIFQGTLTVTDDDGNKDAATFTVVVGDPNHAPQIVSTPPSTARKGVRYVYQVVANDPDLPFGDELAFSLTQAPEGMGIDSLTGRVIWVPPAGAPAANPVTVRVEDSLGLFDEQSFTVTIDPSSFVIVTDDDGRVYYARSNGDGTWSGFRQEFALPGIMRGAAIADFDNDGDWDFIVPANPSGGLLDFNLFLNNGSDQFAHMGAVASSSAGSGAAYGMTAGDLNHDGNMDFLVSRAGPNVVVALGNGRGGFAISEFNTSLADGRDLDVADFDHDGHLDFVRARYSTGQVHLWRGNGLGGFTNAGQVGDPGDDPYGVPAADFNSDGHPDFIGNQGSAGDPYFYPGNGNGTFGSAVYVGSIDFNNYGQFDNYDFDGDGKQDLITVSYSSRIVRYYRGNGNGTFGPELRVNPSNTPGNILGVSAPPGPPPAGDPIARISPDFVVAGPGATVALSGATSSDDGTIVSYAWDFGDGTTGSGIDALHTFPGVERDYVVRLRVTDNTGRVGIGSGLVRLRGAPPVADAGGPYVFGEEFANAGVYTVTLDGTGSTDDGPVPLAYAWNLGNGLDGPFGGDTLNPGVWSSARATLDGLGSALVTGNATWGSSYLVTNRQYARRGGDSYTGRILVRSGGDRHVMWGLKNTNNDYNYTQFYYAIYLQANGAVTIYEGGNNRGNFGTYSNNKSYDVRIDVKPYQGATYFIRETGTQTWTQLYNSSFSTGTPFRAGATVHSGTIEFGSFDTPDESSTAARPSVTLPGVGTYNVDLTVTDGVGQTDRDAATITLTVGAPPVANPGVPVLTEAGANCGKWTGTFDGRGSTDDRGIFRYDWGFGDGQTGTGATTTHTYAAAGTYRVTLTVWDNALQHASASVDVTTVPQNPPVANAGGPYAVNESAAIAGMWTASFSGALSTDDYGICDYTWNFGDGGTGSGVSPTHQYAAAGTYTVTLTVRDDALQSRTATTTIQVSANGLPTSNPGGPYAVNESSAVGGRWTAAFDGSGSTDDFGIWTYQWNFGDGGVGSGSKPTHVYAAPGVYPVTLTVTDNGRQTNSAQTQITVSGNQPPVADAGPVIVTEVGKPVTLDARGSTDDFGIFSYKWDFDGPPFAEAFASGPIDPDVWVSSGATQVGGEAVITGTGVWGNRYLVTAESFQRVAGQSYTGRLLVKSGGNRHVMWGLKNTGSDYNYTQLHHAIYFSNGQIFIYEDGANRGAVGAFADNAPYDVRIDVKQPSGATYYIRSGGAPAWTQIYNSTYSSASPFRLGATVHSGEIHLDDFAGPEPVAKNTDLPVAQFVYRVPGTYQPTVTVTDHALQTDTDSTIVTVLAGASPEADAGGPYNTNEGFPTRFDASRSSDDFGIETYTWSFGDGEGLTTRNSWIDHRYTAAGSYTATLTTADFAGHTDTTTVPVSVSNEPVVAAVPWQIFGATEIHHDAISGQAVTLKAVAWSQKTPLTYAWDFGDGTPPAGGTVANLRAIEASHVYTGVPGRSFDATITVTDANGKTASDTYRVRLTSRSLHTEINLAIDAGLWRLHKDVNLATFAVGTFGNARIDYGYWDQGGGYCPANWFASPTASALQAFEVNGHFEQGDARRNPYVETVARGLRHLPNQLKTFGISVQTYGDPDTNRNGFAIDTIDICDNRPAYEVGQVMDGLIASGTRDTYTITGAGGIIHRTYRDLVIDMVDAYAFGQYDHPTVGGGWRYGGWNQHPDNSVVQWAAIGMIPAERLWGIEIPRFVRERLNVWLNYSYNGTGFGYTEAGNGTNTTPSGLVELAFMNVVGVDDPGTPGDGRDGRWATAENYIANNWNTSFWYPNSSASNRFSYYGYYAFTKAMRLARPAPVERLRATGLDWFFDDTRGIARRLVSRQGTDGGWPRDVNPGGTWVGFDLTNAWSVIMLQALFEVPPVADAGPDRIWGVDVEITLNGCNSYHPDAARGREIILYEWDLDGNGQYDVSGTECTVTHTYTSQQYPNVTTPVSITVSLRVSDNKTVDGVPAPLTDTDSAVVTLTLPPHPPVADPNGPYVATAGIPIQLDGSGSFDINPTDFISAWQWDLDNDGAYDDAFGERPVVIFPTPTSVGLPASIGLRVLDNGVLNDLNGNGEADPNERLEGFGFTDVTVVANTAPVANANGPYAGNEGSQIALDGSGSSDPQGNPLTYAWDLDGDGVFDDASGPAPFFAGIDDGVYPVALEVSDGLLKGTASSQVTVNNLAPDLATIPNMLVTDDPATLTGPFTDPGIQDTHTATIDWGEGAGPEPTAVNQGAGSGIMIGSHIYSADGDYQATVTVRDDDGGMDSQTLTISVHRNDPPVADAGGPYVVSEGGSVPLSASASTDPNPGDVLTFAWDLDADGTFETPGETVAFPALGRDGPDSQEVLVKVTDNDGASDVDSASVTIENAPPLADAGGPYSVVEGDTIPVSATGSDPGGDTLTYAWDLDGDGVFETPGQTAIFSAVGRDGPSSQEIFVRVTDDDGGSTVDTALVTIENAAPEADAGGPYTVQEGGAVSVAATATDVGGDSLTYAWDLDGDGVFETPGQTAVFSAVGRDGPSSQEIFVRVTDDDGASTVDSALVTIENAAPAVDAGGPYTVQEGSTVSVAATGTDVGGDALTYVWDLDGDGVFETPGQSVTFSAVGRDGPASQEIFVRVTDDDGGSAVDSALVTIENAAPAIDAGGPYTVPEGGAVPVSATGTDVGGDALTYAWDLDGDGVFETPGQSVIYSAAGRDGPSSQEIFVRVTDDDGASTVDSALVTIENAAPAADAGGPYSVPEGGTVPVAATGTDVGGDALTYAWDLDGDGVFETAGQTVTFSAAGRDGPSSQEIFVRVTDDDGASTVDAAIVTIENVAPGADAGGPYVVIEGGSIGVAATGSDPGGDTLTYAWDLDGDGVFETAGQAATFPAAGRDGPDTQEVFVKVTDDDGASAVDSAIVTIENADPAVDAGGPYTVVEGGSVPVAATGSDPGGDTLTYAWDLDGDGVFETPGQSVLFPAIGRDGPSSQPVLVQVTDDDGASAVDSAIVTILNAPPVVTRSAPGETVQYSDPIQTYTITASDFAGDPLSAATSFATNGGPFVAGLPNGFSLASSESPGSLILTVSGIADVAPGQYRIRFIVSDDDGASASADLDFVVTQENARATYTGPMLVSTPSVNDTRAVVQLRATIQDITAVAQSDPAWDPAAGDIRNALVTFVNRDANTVIAANLPVGLIDAADSKTGAAVFDWLVDLGAKDSESFTIGIRVGGYYTEAADAEIAVVTVAKPFPGHITGGGYLVNSNSAGAYAGDPGAKTNFGFNVRVNKKRTNLQGNLNTIIRRNGSIFQIKTNATDSLAITPDGKHATFVSKANLTNVTNSTNPVSIIGNLTLIVTLTDLGEPGTSDSIAFTLWNGTTLWFSSHWTGAQTLEQVLGGGNLVIHNMP